MFAKLKLRRRKRPSGSIGCGARSSQTRNSREDRDAAEQRATRMSGIGEAALRLLDQGEHGPGEPERAEHAAEHVDAGPGAGRLRRGTATSTSAERGEHERHVDQEDPAPGAERDEPAADERADHERDPGPGRPGADRGAALLALEGRRDRRERRRGEQRARDPLQRAGDDQRRSRPGAARTGAT